VVIYSSQEFSLISNSDIGRASLGSSCFNSGSVSADLIYSFVWVLVFSGYAVVFDVLKGVRGQTSVATVVVVAACTIH